MSRLDYRLRLYNAHLYTMFPRLWLILADIPSKTKGAKTRKPGVGGLPWVEVRVGHRDGFASGTTGRFWQMKAGDWKYLGKSEESQVKESFLSCSALFKRLRRTLRC